MDARQRELEKAIETVLQEVQRLSGRSVQAIELRTKPIGDLEGFDSLSGLEATVLLAELLNIDIAPDVNLFVSDDGRRALTVKAIAERLAKMTRGLTVALHD